MSRRRAAGGGGGGATVSLLGRGHIEPVGLEEELQRSYLDYAM
jgi:DNA gyrase/topoisomerase IV subunit A